MMDRTVAPVLKCKIVIIKNAMIVISNVMFLM